MNCRCIGLYSPLAKTGINSDGGFVTINDMVCGTAGPKMGVEEEEGVSFCDVVFHVVSEDDFLGDVLRKRTLCIVVCAFDFFALGLLFSFVSSNATILKDIHSFVIT